jgi:DNA-binding NarL/FixJ family response regulator
VKARRIQVATLADSGLFRSALSSRLVLEDEMEVVSTAGTIYELVVRAQGRPIDVLLVYLSILSPLTLEIVFDIKLLLPATRIVVLGCEPGNPQPVRWIEAGAWAWLEHDASYDALLEAIRAVAEGRTFYATEVMTDVIGRIARLREAGRDRKGFEEEPLTDRESEAARWVRLGLSNKEIAQRLGVKQATAKKYVARVLGKLGGLEHRRDLDLRGRGGWSMEEG